MAALLAATLAALLVPAVAAAKSYSLPQADIQVAVAPDGSLRIDEHITYAFSGPFSGAYRDIPLREGEVIDGVVVSEGDRVYEPGGDTRLGSSDTPGTYGTEQVDDVLRVVWHYSAADEVRTFTITYRFRFLTVVHDDVADVNLKVWGDQWPVALGRLTATLTLPGDASGGPFRAWGHPVWVRGDVQLAGDQVLLRALNVPAGQFVELRTLFPRTLLESTAGAKVEAGPAFDRIVDEELDDSRQYERDQEKIRKKAAFLRSIPVSLKMTTRSIFLLIRCVSSWLAALLRTTLKHSWIQTSRHTTRKAYNRPQSWQK